jgi:hypothetical protein
MVAEKPQKKAAYSASQAAFSRCHRGARDRLGLPQLLLGFDGGHSERARSLGVILVSCQSSLGIREVGQSVIEWLTQLNDGCLSAGKLLAELYYPQIGRRRLSMTVADIRDLTNEVRPIDLVDHPLAGSGLCENVRRRCGGSRVAGRNQAAAGAVPEPEIAASASH